MAFITIITPTYNASQCIAECLDSVQRQTFSDYEHMILDGLSADDTVSLVKEWQKRTDKLRLFSEKDDGIYAAMNKGIHRAAGEWLYFLGADDILYDEKVLEKIVVHLRKGDAQILYGDVFFRNNKKLYDGVFDMEKILKKNLCHQSVFYHRTVFEQAGTYNLKYRTEADYDLNLKCWLGGSIKHAYVSLVIARFADGGLSSANADLMFWNDFPETALEGVILGNWGSWQKINWLSKVYRKIFQRFSFPYFISLIFRSPAFYYRFPAFLWMCLTSPYYLLKPKV
jgi:glycosyltransferase involved in cell wall biosynthesis